MGSINATEVAKEVLEKVGKGEKISVSAIARKKGYANSVAKNPKKITSTKSFKDVVAPVVKAMEKQREMAIRRMTKTISKAKYRDLVDSVDKLTKNIQLLSGKDTGKENVTFTWE